MQLFTKQDKIIDLVNSNYHLLPVINRFGVKLGNKDKNLEKICELNAINLDFFLVIVNTFHNQDYFPEEQLKSFSPQLIVDYLRKTHNYYITYLLPKIESTLNQLIESNQTDIHELDIIRQFYQKYKNELLIHINEEEEKVFPYVENLITNSKTTSDYNIHTFDKEHTNVHIKLEDLKSLIIKYIEPVYDHNICSDFLISLYQFEKDLSDHARIEDKILIPVVVEMEQRING